MHIGAALLHLWPMHGKYLAGVTPYRVSLLLTAAATADTLAAGVLHWMTRMHDHVYLVHGICTSRHPRLLLAELMSLLTAAATATEVTTSIVDTWWTLWGTPAQLTKPCTLLTGAAS